MMITYISVFRHIRKYEYDSVFHIFKVFFFFMVEFNLPKYFKNMHEYAFVSKSLKVIYVFVGVFKHTIL